MGFVQCMSQPTSPVNLGGDLAQIDMIHGVTVGHV